jgi:hypothetical protein
MQPIEISGASLIWKKADIYKIKEDLTIFNTTRKNIDINVESMWQAFKTAIQITIEKRVPPFVALALDI